MSTRLKLLRQQHGLSLEQLAQRSGLTKSYVSKVERGLSTPSIASALKLARALAVDVAQLFSPHTEAGELCLTRADQRLRIGSPLCCTRQRNSAMGQRRPAIRARNWCGC